MSESSPCSLRISEHVADIARYSSSVDDLEPFSCFLHFQEIRLLPKNMHHQVVDLLVFRQPAQPATVKRWRLKVYNNTILGVEAKLHQAVKWKKSTQNSNRAKTPLTTLNRLVGPLRGLHWWFWTMIRSKIWGDTLILLLLKKNNPIPLNIWNSGRSGEKQYLKFGKSQE